MACVARLRQLFVGGFVSYLRYFCLFAHSGLQHILCCVFDLFFFLRLVYHMLPISLDYVGKISDVNLPQYGKVELSRDGRNHY